MHLEYVVAMHIIELRGSQEFKGSIENLDIGQDNKGGKSMHGQGSFECSIVSERQLNIYEMASKAKQLKRNYRAF